MLKISSEQEINKFCEDYKQFISLNKTERECVCTCVKIANENGFKNLQDVIKNNEKLKCGDKVFAVAMGKVAVFAEIGEQDIEDGCNFIASHIDSPRIDLKSRPFFEKEGFAYFDTHYYGGIRQYQWLTLPLALKGVVVKKNGDKNLMNIGDGKDEPVFVITDILPHFAKDYKIEKLNGEMLDVLVGSSYLKKADGSNGTIKENLFEILKKNKIEEGDFASAEIEIVPAGAARDVGFDRSLIAGYGQDDRVCVFSSFSALINNKEKLKRTAVCMFVDKEEIGSVGATGATSSFVENIIAEICLLLNKTSHLAYKRCLANSFGISADVVAGYDPNFANAYNKNTAAILGKGISFEKYGGSRGKNNSNDTNAEFIAKIRNILDGGNIVYQFTETAKVDIGGGGTIAYMLARYGMEVIDGGPAILSMHSPWEVVSKFDIFECYKAYQTFFNS